MTLLDPDRLSREKIVERAVQCEECGADAILFGSSLLVFTHDFDGIVRDIKRVVRVPVIIFPGEINQVSPHADAILFLSMVSGRNADLLIGRQVRAAPVLKNCGLEAISTGYMLVESGSITTAEYMSNTRTIPRGKPDIAMAHALAAEYIGMKCIYLDTGSGASDSVPTEMVRAVANYVSLPVIVGGGIHTSEIAREKVRAGASFVVTGNALEENDDPSLIRAFSCAVHTKESS